MRLDEQYSGRFDPFEGDRTLWLRTLPAHAQVTNASLTVSPIEPPDASLFEERVEFRGNQGYLAETERKVATKVSTPSFVEVDFHTRRVLTGVSGTHLTGTTLQIDLGGTYVELNDRGSIRTPSDSQPFSMSGDTVILPSLTVTKLKLTRSASPPGTTIGGSPSLPPPDITGLTLRSVPSNLSVRLGQMPSFWTVTGDIPSAIASPDFAAILNAFLAGITPDQGFYAIPVVIHSDAIARFNVTLQIEYVLTQRALPDHLPEATLSYNFGTLPNSHDELLQITLPPGAIPIKGQNLAQLRGEFKPTRIALGPVGTIGPTLPIAVSPDRALAQPFSSQTEISVTAIDLLFSKTQANLAGLNVAIQTDADGKPSGEVLVSADVIVGKPLPPDETSWGSATLPNPLRILAHDGEGQPIRYWLVLQSQIGQAFWQSQPMLQAEPGLHDRNAEGLAWRSATYPGETAPLAALFRLRNQPEQFTVPLQLQIGRGSNVVLRRLNEFAPLGRVEFQFDFSDSLAEYLTYVQTSSPCGSDDRITNGTFSEPPCDDATLKLFDLTEQLSDAHQRGFFVATQGNFSGERFLGFRGRPIRRDIDLSVAQYIVLQIEDERLPQRQRPIRIRCSGLDPTRTTLDQVIQAINSATGRSDLALRTVVRRGPSPNEWEVSIGDDALTLRLYLWCSTDAPSGWQTTPGYVLRLQLPIADAHRLAVLLVDPDYLNEMGLELYAVPPRRTATPPELIRLSQRIDCQAGCTYQLQFMYGLMISPESANQLPTWQIVWMNQAGETVHIDQASIDPFDREHQPAPGEGPSESEDLSVTRLHEAIATAPSEAVHAEIRFVQPPPGGLWLESVQFKPTSEVIRNSSFLLQQGEDWLHWQWLSGRVSPSEAGERTGIVLGADAGEDTVLMQAVEVAAGSSYELKIRAQRLSISTGDPQPQAQSERSRLELRWLDTALSPEVILLDGLEFAHRIWTGTAPDGVTEAEIRLIQPKGPARLQIQSVSLQRVGDLSVPLVFFSEAPGELTLSNISVTYDMPAPPPPLLPPGEPAPLLQLPGSSDPGPSTTTVTAGPLLAGPSIGSAVDTLSEPSISGGSSPGASEEAVNSVQPFTPAPSPTPTLTPIPTPPSFVLEAPPSRLSHFTTAVPLNLSSSDSIATRIIAQPSSRTATLVADPISPIPAPTPAPNGNGSHPIAPASLASPVPLVELPPSLSRILVGTSPRAQTHMQHGYTLISLKDDIGAIAHYTQVIHLEPNKPITYIAHRLRGDAYYRLGYYPEAIADYDAMIQIVPLNGFTHHQRGLAHAALGHRDAAIADLQSASELFQQQGKWEQYRTCEAWLNENGEF